MERHHGGSVERGQAIVEVDGKRRTLTIGQHYRGSIPGSDRQSITVAADPRGHFIAEGAVNGNRCASRRHRRDHRARCPPTRCASASTIARADPGSPTPPPGSCRYRVTLDTVRLGGIELNSVEATVIERGLDVALLGMSFLNRVEMRREGHSMTLTRRF